MNQWYEPTSLAPNWRVVNRSVSGTTTAYWNEHLAAVLAEERPDAVLAYVGSNDFAEGLPAEAIQSGVRRCRELLHEQFPAAPFGYLAIIKAPQRLGRFEGISTVNAAVRATLAPSDLWLETDPVFLADGQPVAACYIEDGLHLNAEAYRAFTAALRPSLDLWLAPLTPSKFPAKHA